MVNIYNHIVSMVSISFNIFLFTIFVGVHYGLKVGFFKQCYTGLKSAHTGLNLLFCFLVRIYPEVKSNPSAVLLHHRYRWGWVPAGLKVE